MPGTLDLMATWRCRGAGRLALFAASLHQAETGEASPDYTEKDTALPVEVWQSGLLLFLHPPGRGRTGFGFAADEQQ